MRYHQSPRAKEALQLISDLINTQKVLNNGHFTWESYMTRLTSIEGLVPDNDPILYNLGLAHGIPSILFTLSKIYSKNINQKVCLSLIESGINWLIMHSNNPTLDEQNLLKYNFPSYKTINKGWTQSKIAWCYGDLSLSHTLGLIANNISNRQLFIYGQKLGLQTASNYKYFIDATDEGGLCHGAAGNAYIFHKLKGLYCNQIFEEVSTIYLKKLISLQNELDYGVAGYKTHRYDITIDKKYLYDDRGLINGTSGIGLVLISMLSGKYSEWDSAILLS